MALTFYISGCPCCGGPPPAVSPVPVCSSFSSPNWLFDTTGGASGFPHAGWLGVLSIHGWRSAGSIATATVSGWTLKYTATHHSGKHRIHIFTRLLDGSETPSIVIGNTSGYDKLQGEGISFAVPSNTWNVVQATSSEYSAVVDGLNSAIHIPQLTPATGSYLLASGSFWDNGGFNVPSANLANMPGGGTVCSQNRANPGAASMLMVCGVAPVTGGSPTSSSYGFTPGGSSGPLGTVCAYEGIGLAATIS